MPDREESYTPRTLEQFIGRGLSPCDGCLQKAIRWNSSPILGRRVYDGRFTDPFIMDAGTCPRCGFFVRVSGTVKASPDIMRAMRRREAKANRGRNDVEVNAGPQVPTGGGLQGMRHSDTKTEFETGAKRDTDEGKGRASLISPVLIHRTAVHLAEGAKHYGDDNWLKGMPFRRTADSLINHVFHWLAGDEEEDHLAAIVCNTMFLMHFEEAIANGSLPASLDDRSQELKKILPSILTSLKKDPKIVMMSKKELEAHRGTR